MLAGSPRWAVRPLHLQDLEHTRKKMPRTSSKQVLTGISQVDKVSHMHLVACILSAADCNMPTSRRGSMAAHPSYPLLLLHTVHRL